MGAAAPVVGIGLTVAGGIAQQQQQAEAAKLQASQMQYQYDAARRQFAADTANAAAQTQLSQEMMNFAKSSADRTYQQEAAIIKSNQQLALQNLQNQQSLLDLQNTQALQDLQNQQVLLNQQQQTSVSDLEKQRLRAIQENELAAALLGELELSLPVEAQKSALQEQLDRVQASADPAISQIYEQTAGRLAQGTKLVEQFKQQFGASEEDAQRLLALFAGASGTQLGQAARSASNQNILEELQAAQQVLNRNSRVVGESLSGRDVLLQLANAQEAVGLRRSGINRFERDLNLAQQSIQLQNSQNQLATRQQLLDSEYAQALANIQQQVQQQQTGIDLNAIQLATQLAQGQSALSSGILDADLQTERDLNAANAQRLSAQAAADAEGAARRANISGSVLARNAQLGSQILSQPITPKPGILGLLNTAGQAFNTAQQFGLF